ncbi:MAG: PAS domain S-box protein [Candidatus Zixiibacteriota bacterium]|nr:MAG: PAS domain S-box protein [candidate division Zixibacteria bacterium]
MFRKVLNPASIVIWTLHFRAKGYAAEPEQHAAEEGAHHFLTVWHDWVLLALVLAMIAVLIINYYRIKSQKALRESEGRFKALAERSMVGISVVQDGLCRYVNPRLAEILGYSESEIVDRKGPIDFCHPEERARVELSLNRRIAGDEDFAHYEVRIITKAGEIRDVEVFGSRMIYQGRPALIASMLDITERKRIQNELRKTHSDLAQVLESAPPLLVVGKDLTILRANNSLCSKVGQSHEDVIGGKCYDIWNSSLCHTPDCPMERILSGSPQANYERENVDENGQTAILAATALPYFAVDGSVQGMIASFNDITELKRREQDLRQSEEKARAQFLSIPVATYIWQYVDGDFVFTDFNDEAMRITGGVLPSLLGKKLSEAFPDRADWRTDMLRCLRDKTTVRLDKPVPYNYRLTGETRNLMVSYAYVPPDYVMVHTADITARIKAEEALKASEDRFKTLAEQSPVGIYVFRDRAFAYVNRKVAEIMGRCADELVEMADAYSMVHPDDKDEVIRVFEDFESSSDVSTSVGFRVLTAEGKSRNVEVYVSKIIYEGQRSHIGTLLDVSERIRAEEALKESERKFRALAETTNAAILIYNEDGPLYHNPAAELITGFSAAELSRMDPWGMTRPDYWDSLKEMSTKRLAGDGSVRRSYEVPIITKSGEEKWVLYSAETIQFGGKPAVLGTAVDITERRRAEAELRTAHLERYEQIKQIAGGVAHEIYNALFPAATSIDKLKGRIGNGDDEDTDRDIKLLDLAETSVERAIQMTDLVTQFSRLESDTDAEAVDLRTLFHEILKDRTRIDQMGVKLTVKAADGSVVRMNRLHAHSLFSNVINNALDAMEDVEKRTLSVSASRNARGVVVKISDTGSGIAPDIKAKLFSPFFSTKPRTGTGLGLAICKRIVDIYGGQICVDSALDRGTTFSIFLKT